MIQMKIPVDLEKIIEITDEIYTFSEIIDEIDLLKYYSDKESIMGRPRYDAEKFMKVALFAFMENGYSSLRNIEKLCKTDVRYIWLLDGEKAPSYVTIGNFLREYVGKNIETLFADVNNLIFAKEGVDLNRLYPAFVSASFRGTFLTAPFVTHSSVGSTATDFSSSSFVPV